MAAPTKSRWEAYHEAWTSGLISVLSMLNPGEWKVSTAASTPLSTFAVRLRIAASGGLQGRQWVSFSSADLALLLGIFLQEEVVIARELTSSQADAITEFVRQWAGMTATALEPVFGTVVLEVAIDTVPERPSTTARLLRATQESQSIAVLFESDDAILGGLDRRTRSPNNPPSMEALLRDGNIALLLDVELAVMLRFGCRRATLREVLELTSGAVLELDREIQEPVELLLNGRVIARGDVVVVDGNYGLRVTEVASPQQRVKSL